MSGSYRMNNSERKRNYLREWRKKNRGLNVILENEINIFSDYSEDLHGQSIGVESPQISDKNEISSEAELSIESERTTGSESLSDNGLSDNESSGTDISLGANANDSNSENEELGMVNELAKWILAFKISRSASNKLLQILRQNGHGDLPKCTRTILQTPRCVASEKKCGGDYIYLGIARGITRTLNANAQHNFENDTISLVVNVDGVPLYKSSSVQAWPLLCMFGKTSPFIVAVFVGNSKPSNLGDFLHDFIVEYEMLSENGFEHDGHIFHLKLLAFVCDAPARQFLKGIKAHNGYHGCERCVVEGTYESSRMLFQDLHCDLRDGESFKNGMYMGTHQKDNTPLCDVGINCIKQFPLDYMHLVCLGVMKRLLLSWKEGPRQLKLSPTQLRQISAKLEELKGKMPSEFARQPRGLENLKRWKATEYRQFLLYTGCVVLKDVLSPQAYKHFICFSLAIGVMLEENAQIRNEFLDYAKDLLKYFVSKCADFYGSTFTVYNVHSLIHLWEDSQNFNTSLDDFSSFPFENYLQVVKKFVRKSENPLAQIVKRIGELENLAMSGTTQKTSTTKISKMHKDSWFLLQSGDFAQIKEINGDGSCVCDVISKRHHKSLFFEPCDSRQFNIIYVRNIHSVYKRKKISRGNLLRKALCLPYKQGYMIRSLLNNVIW